jgi:hypothetical protein
MTNTEAKHKWRGPYGCVNHPHCQVCGMIKNDTNHDKPCRGPVSVGPRAMTEATRIVAEWMGAKPYGGGWAIFHHGGAAVHRFDPTTNANDEQLAIKHARQHLTLAEQLRAVNYVSDVARNRLGARLGRYETWIETGDWTKAIAKVLAERKEQDND